MSITAKQLIESLSNMNPDHEVILSNGEPIVHICSLSDGRTVISDTKPEAYCARCDDYVYPETQIKKYKYFCPTCGENMLEFETYPLEPERKQYYEDGTPPPDSDVAITSV